MDNETHPFQVSVWVSGNNNSKSLFERGVWSEIARCADKFSAEEVALCLSLRHQDGVRVAELSSDGRYWRHYKHIPEGAKELL
jgi:hypothetical protein